MAPRAVHVLWARGRCSEAPAGAVRLQRVQRGDLAGITFAFCASQQWKRRLVQRGLREAEWGPQLLRVPVQPPHQLRHPDASGAAAGEAQQGSGSVW